MADIKLHVIKPSVNNMSARVFVRAAKLDFTEDDVYGKTRSEEFLAKNPAHLTPMMEADHLPKGVMWESCAIMQYLSNKHHLDKFYPTDPEKRAMVDSAMFYIVGTLYPYIVRSTYGALGFPQYAGEVGASDADAGEFLKVIDYHFPAWAKTYMAAIAKALGDAYAEPAKDVEGYIAYVKGKKG
jgi:glutathione S-transferase